MVSVFMAHWFFLQPGQYHGLLSSSVSLSEKAAMQSSRLSTSATL